MGDGRSAAHYYSLENKIGRPQGTARNGHLPPLHYQTIDLRSKRNPGFSPRDTVSLGPTTRRLERCSLAVGIASRQRVRLDQESGTLATSLSLSLYLDLDLDLDLDSGQHDEPVAM